MLVKRSGLLILAAAFACASLACAQKSGGGGSSKKDDAEEEDGEDEDDDGAETDTSTATEPGISEDEEQFVPDADNFKDFFEPPEKQQCLDDGKVFLYCTKKCSAVVSHPAAFTCDRAGIEATFANVLGFKEDFVDYLDNKKYFIDQCGVTSNQKPFVALACFTKGDGVCVDKDDVDTEEAEVLTHFLSTDQAAVEQCP